MLMMGEAINVWVYEKSLYLKKKRNYICKKRRRGQSHDHFQVSSLCNYLYWYETTTTKHTGVVIVFMERYEYGSEHMCLRYLNNVPLLRY